MLEDCSHCAVQGESHKRCAKCKRALYCSKEHQVQHWPSHKHACASQCANAQRSAATRYMFSTYYKDNQEVQQTFKEVLDVPHFFLSEFQTPDGFECIRETHPEGFARVHRRCCHKDMVDETVRASIATDIVVDDVAMLNDVNKFSKWVSTASDEATKTFVDKCVPGYQVGCVDFTGRGKALECVEGVSSDDLLLYPSTAVLSAFYKHLNSNLEKKKQNDYDNTMLSLRQLCKVAAAMGKSDIALAHAREMYNIACTDERKKVKDEREALYLVVIYEAETNQFEDAVRHADFGLSKHYPRNSWQDHVADWLSFRVATANAKLHRGDIWGAHEALQESAAAMFKWNGDKLSQNADTCALRCNVLGIKCSPCKFVLDYFIFTDKSIFDGVMTKYDKFSLTSEECERLEMLAGEATSLALTAEDLKAMATFRRALAGEM